MSEDLGQLVYQKGKKLNAEYCVISVRETPERVNFSVYELERAQTYTLSFSRSDFDDLFKLHPELSKPESKEGRYDWIVDRIDLTTASTGDAKQAVLAGEPTCEDAASSGSRPPQSPRIPKDRLTYAERAKLQEEAAKLEEQRSANIAFKREKTRKAFVAELQEKKKLEELKLAARRQRIHEERCAREEKAALQRARAEEKKNRYSEMEQNRKERIALKEDARGKRDLQAVMKLLDDAKQQEELAKRRLEEARDRAKVETEDRRSQVAAKKAEDAKLDKQRVERIALRQARQKERAAEYLVEREIRIEQLKQEALVKEDLKQQILRDRAVQHAEQIRAKQAKDATWEQLEDQRAKSNMAKEHSRDVLVLEHIDRLRSTYAQQLSEAAARKQVAQDARKEQSARELQATAEETRLKSELQDKRSAKIAAKEELRQEKDRRLIEQIRGLQSTEQAQTQDHVDSLQAYEKRLEQRRSRCEKEDLEKRMNEQREQRIRQKQLDRDRKFAAEFQKMKDEEKEKQAAIEAKKASQRQQATEAAQKHSEDKGERRQRVEQLSEQREQKIEAKEEQRNQREQERLQNQGA